MSFQAYIDNIKAKTGKTPADFKKMAEQKEFIIDGKINPKWKAIHYGVSASKGSQECGNDHPTSLKQVVDNYDENEYYGPKFSDPKLDYGHPYGKYGCGPEEWYDYLDANGIDCNSD